MENKKAEPQKKPEIKADFPGLVKMTEGNITKYVPVADVERYKGLGYRELN